MTKKLTQQDMNWLFTSPGCDYCTDNQRGGHCAFGKFIQHGIYSGFNDEKSNVVSINNVGRDDIYISMNEGWSAPNNSPIKYSYLPGDPRWDKHERALKIGLQILIKKGFVEIEDEAAQEFGLIKQSALASNSEEKVPV